MGFSPKLMVPDSSFPKLPLNQWPLDSCVSNSKTTVHILWRVSLRKKHILDSYLGASGEIQWTAGNVPGSRVPSGSFSRGIFLIELRAESRVRHRKGDQLVSPVGPTRMQPGVSSSHLLLHQFPKLHHNKIKGHLRKYTMQFSLYTGEN